jgi:hypothetical protein
VSAARDCCWSSLETFTSGGGAIGAKGASTGGPRPREAAPVAHPGVPEVLADLDRCFHHSWSEPRSLLAYDFEPGPNVKIRVKTKTAPV